MCNPLDNYLGKISIYHVEWFMARVYPWFFSISLTSHLSDGMDGMDRINRTYKWYISHKNIDRMQRMDRMDGICEYCRSHNKSRWNGSNGWNEWNEWKIYIKFKLIFIRYNVWTEACMNYIMHELEEWNE